MSAYQPIAVPVSLESLPRHARAQVVEVDWAVLAEPEARRLRELGFDTGAAVEVTHRATLGGGPLAVKVGRMTVALRRRVARAIHVTPLAA